MKKFSKILGMVACAFVLVLSGALMTACGIAKPYSVKGVTLQGTEEISIVWEEGTTQQDKEKFWEEQEVSNDHELLEKLSKSEDIKQIAATTFAFGEDGKCVYTLGEETGVLYYIQSEDLKNIDIYVDKECTSLNYHSFAFIDGSFMWKMSSICVKLKKV